MMQIHTIHLLLCVNIVGEGRPSALMSEGGVDSEAKAKAYALAFESLDVNGDGVHNIVTQP